MKKSLLFFLLAMIVIINNNISAQNNNLKTYNGEFSMSGFDWYPVKGNVTYQYRDAADGTRIFEGDFEFSYIDYASMPNNVNKKKYRKFEAKGTFKNNRQVGQWTWKRTWHTETEHGEELRCVLNFDDNGYVTGQFQYDVKSGKVWMKGFIENGIIVSLSYKWATSNIIAEGRYNKEGKPMGKWNYGKAMMIYDSWGHFKEFYAVDPTTGDKIICNHYSVKRPPEAYVDAIEMINERCFRSTPKLK